MSFHPELWYGFFAEGRFPLLPCPQCKPGRLVEVSTTYSKMDAGYAAGEAGDPDLPEDYIRRAFVLIAKCANPSCGEVVSVAGEFGYEEEGTEHGWGLSEVLRPKAMYPAPPMIDLPNETPSRVAARLERAFQLFWADYGACANSLRSACEAIIDAIKVPKTGVNKAGKTIDLDLNGRIQLLKKSDPHNAKIIHALRMIGNLGSHGSDVKQHQLFDALKLMDYLLSELFEKNTIQELAKAIVDSKAASSI